MESMDDSNLSKHESQSNDAPKARKLCSSSENTSHFSDSDSDSSLSVAFKVFPLDFIWLGHYSNVTISRTFIAVLVLRIFIFSFSFPFLS